MEALILAVLIGNFLLEITLSVLNQRNMLKPWPIEVRGIFTQVQVKRAVKYSRENFQFSAISKIISTALMIMMIVEGGFSVVNNLAISISSNE